MFSIFKKKVVEAPTPPVASRLPSWSRYIGNKVIVITNESDDIFIATYLGKQDWGSEYGEPKWGYPMFKTESGETVGCGGINIPYTPELYQFLKSLPKKQVWDMMSELSLHIRECR